MVTSSIGDSGGLDGAGDWTGAFLENRPVIARLADIGGIWIKKNFYATLLEMPFTNRW